MKIKYKLYKVPMVEAYIYVRIKTAVSLAPLRLSRALSVTTLNAMEPSRGSLRNRSMRSGSRIYVYGIPRMFVLICLKIIIHSSETRTETRNVIS